MGPRGPKSLSNGIHMSVSGHWYAWISAVALSFCFGADWANIMLLLAFAAIKDGIRGSGFSFDTVLHEGKYAPLIAIGFI